MSGHIVLHDFLEEKDPDTDTRRVQKWMRHSLGKESVKGTQILYGTRSANGRWNVVVVFTTAAIAQHAASVLNNKLRRGRKGQVISVTYVGDPNANHMAELWEGYEEDEEEEPVVEQEGSASASQAPVIADGHYHGSRKSGKNHC
ncbi:hypothetical protein SUNI508_11964 [Seiridium unicorne]|uniref:Helicase C-terminal domain-containing protein n=1 Tax=Seiridium unicorne TaxID=138068 RepID=A0ABR2UFC3_9PEZI